MMKSTAQLLLFIMLATLSCTAQQEFNLECENAPPTKREGSMGTLYSNLEIRIPFIYDNLETIRGEGLYIARTDGKTGIVDCDGKIVMPFNYSYIKNWLQPFGKQADYYVASKTQQDMWGQSADKKEVLNDWGVIDIDEKVIVPMQYGYVRVIDENLIVARKDRDTILHFFSNKGKELYTIPGKKVMPGFNDETIGIDPIKGTDYPIYKNGTRVLAPEMGYCSWANDQYYLVYRDEKSGLIDKAGNVIIPFEYNTLRHHYKNDFYFSNATDHMKSTGVYRIGEGVVLEPQHFIEAYGDTYFGYDEKGEKMRAFDRNGKEILPLDKYWTSRDRNELKLLNFDNKTNPIKILNQTTNLSGLMSHDGKMILPIEFKSIKSVSPAHPIIVTTDAGYNIYAQTATKLLAKEYKLLQHTADPKIFIARNENDEFGLLDISAPEKTEFKYKSIEYLSPGFLTAKVKEDPYIYFIIRDDGTRLSEKTYKNISKAEYNAKERFHRTPEKKGELIATSSTYVDSESKTIGINIEGEEFILIK